MTKESSRSTYKIYVGNLAPGTTNDDLFKVFSSFGIVVEAIALSGKGFGFVHMANEMEGVRAMKALYKHQLNGKEMVVQTAINPKKASVTPFSRKATFGKGISTLDDFEDFGDFDAKFFDQELQYISEESPPPTNEVVTPNNFGGGFPQQQSSSSGAVNNNISQLNTIGLSKNNSVPNLRPIQAPPIAAAIGTRPLSLDNNNSLGLNTLVASGFPPKQVHLVGNHLNNNSVIGTSVNGNLNSSVAPSWNFPGNSPQVVVASSAIGNISSISSHVNAGIVPLGSVITSSGDNNSSAFLPDQILNSRVTSHQQQQLSSNLASLNASTAFNNNGGGVLGQHSSQQQAVLNQIQHMLQNSSSSQLSSMQGSKINGGNSLTQEQIESNFNKIKQLQQVHEQLQHQLLDRQQQQQFHLQQQPLVNNSSNNGLLSNLPDTSFLMSNTMASSTNAASNTNNTPTTSLHNISSTQQQHSAAAASPRLPTCGLCSEVFNASDRLPKILGCTHTFCLSCLKGIAALSSNVIKCPSGCGVVTNLTEAGVTGLTTNQGFLANLPQFQQLNNSVVGRQDQSPQLIEVCALCTGTKQEQPLIKCKEEGHTIVPAQDAIKVILGQLHPLVKESLSTLRDTMALRSANKERVLSTLNALAKFMEELKLKVERDDSEETVYKSMQNNLTRVLQQVEGQSYVDLLRAYHMVETCYKDINIQYNHIRSATTINEALQAVIIQINPKTLPTLSKMGLSHNEHFGMEQSLLDHARVGNYANVLLQYMISDLLATRVTHNVVQDKEALITTEKCLDGITNADSMDNLSSLQETRSVSSVSPLINDCNNFNGNVNGVFRSLTTSSSATPDMNAMASSIELDSLSNAVGDMELNCVLQTTEAIEAQNSNMPHFSEDSVSLGLSNIITRVGPENALETSIDLEKSLLEGSACIDPVPVSVQSSAPSPNGSNSINSISPPIENVAHVDSSAASSDSGISSCNKPFSYLDAAKKPAKPPPEPQPKNEVAKIPSYPIKQIKSPHAWMRIAVDGKSIGRVVFQLRPDKAPKMCENFLGLCTGKGGYGYKGTHFFKNGEGFLAGGDVEHDNGSGGYSIFGREKFEADLCPLKDDVGMIRFKGNGTSENGRGMVGSQFMVWYAEREFKKFSYSLVFGRVVDGLDVVKKAADINLAKSDVTVEDCGGIV